MDSIVFIIFLFFHGQGPHDKTLSFIIAPIAAAMAVAAGAMQVAAIKKQQQAS